MRPRRQQIAILCAAQAGCLAVGLLLQNRLMAAIASASGNAAVTQSFDWNTVFPLTFLWIAGTQAVCAWLLLQRMFGQHSLKEQQSQEENLRTARELVRTRDAVIFGLAKLAESRDPDTGHHLERIALYSTRISQALRRHPKYRDIVTQQFVRTIGISSALHDIGKVGVEDAILLKPGTLTDAERHRIQVHAALGGDCIRQIERRLGNSTFLSMAREIALYHHERWDGAGYPHGLKAEDIPLAARIVSIADVYDALSVKRVYKEALPHEVCVDKIRREAGKQFDPELVEVFLSIEPQIAEIAERLRGQAREGVDLGEMFDQAHRTPPRMSAEQEAVLEKTLAEELFPSQKPVQTND
jgi:putative two-component system response regulator